MQARKVILIIMDGWGLGKFKNSDAIQNAKTPFVSSLYQKYPNTTLTTCGEAVGLPEGQMGNSEVGHLNLGAGKIVYQELQRINVAIKEGFFKKAPQLLQSVLYAKENNKPLHLIGLVSNGGVHSHIDHLKAILDVCAEVNLNEVYIHGFTDGRDCDPKSGLGFITELQQYINKTTAKIATISGRYYAMDRDNRWERIKLAYDALVNAKGEVANNATEAIENSYNQNITDEFIKPTVIHNGSNLPVATIKNGDAVICFNFRTDRCREITKVLTQADFPNYDMQKLHLHYTTMTEYDVTFQNVYIIFETDNLVNTLGEVLQQHGKKQIRISETEKYPHVTFFFSGGRELPFEGERRIMITSPKVVTYDLKPEMSAYEVTDALLPEINKASPTGRARPDNPGEWGLSYGTLQGSPVGPLEEGAADFICLNYANADMVGHTGFWNAVIKAVETVDTCVQRIVIAALQNNYTVFLTADHGNADYMINEDGTPNTAHTLNPVPFFIIDNEWRGSIKKGKLADIAPTILTMMNLPVPTEMTGEILI